MAAARHPRESKQEGIKNKHREHEDSYGVNVRVSDDGERFTFFFGSDTPFSQWHPAEFELDSVKYYCAEQYMMHQKAGEWS